jgi:phosphatidylserine decarboxylase
VRFAPEGYPFIGAGLALAAAAWIVARQVGGVWTSGAAVVVTLLALFMFWFFRDPLPVLPQAAELVVAPGHGRVIDIREVEEHSYLRARARRISIFLSVFDVHVQRAPVTGTVEHREHRRGAYAVAWADEASEHNEQASLGVATPQGRVLVRQIAGLVARRIVTDPVEGDRVERGQRIGLIRFGSRVELFLPPEWDVTCAVGDKVRVGSTPLARVPVRIQA